MKKLLALRRSESTALACAAGALIIGAFVLSSLQANSKEPPGPVPHAHADRVITSGPSNTAKSTANRKALSSAVRVPTSALHDGTHARIGDRLRVSFMEPFSMPRAMAQPAGGGTGSVVQSFFQRADLSGEFTIEAEGRISLPMLGDITVADLTLADIKTNLANAFERKMGRRVEVGLNILQRSPVYVIGMVRNPGAFTYQPGMVVTQALALSGGSSQQEITFERALLIAGERSKIAKAKLDLIRLLARNARIVAERNRSEELQLPARLVALVGRSKAERLIATETQMSKAASLGYAQRLLALRQDITARRTEVWLLQERVKKVAQQIAVRSERATKLKQLKGRQGTTNERLAAAQRDLLDIEGQHLDIRVALAGAEKSLNAKNAEMILLGMERRSKLEERHDDITRQIAEVEQILESGNSLVGLAGKAFAADQPRTISIMRRRGSELTVSTASEIELLEPGDIVRVGPARSVPTPLGQITSVGPDLDWTYQELREVNPKTQ